MERAHQELQEEHALVKKLIRCTSARKPTLRGHRRRAEAVRRDAAVSALRGHAGGVLCVAAPADECASEAGPGLLEEMRAIFEGSGGTYGQSADSGEPGRAWTPGQSSARGTADAGGRTAGPGGACLSRKAATHRWFSRQPNHVRRTQATHPNQIWVGDVTYLGGRRPLVVSDRRLGSVLAPGAGVATRGDA